MANRLAEAEQKRADMLKEIQIEKIEKAVALRENSKQPNDNLHALREFWARAPADALGVKQELEKVLAKDGKPSAYHPIAIE